MDFSSSLLWSDHSGFLPTLVSAEMHVGLCGHLSTMLAYTLVPDMISRGEISTCLASESQLQTFAGESSSSQNVMSLGQSMQQPLGPLYPLCEL